MNKKELNNFYNSKANQNRYTYSVDNVGLWESERILIEKYATKDSKILDLGCGAGRTTINLYKLGYKNITGLDYSEKLIECAKEYCNHNNLNINFMYGDATHLSCFKDNDFDFILFSYNGLMSIPQQENRDKVLKEVYRTLKKDGIFIFTAHDRNNPKYKEIWKLEKKKWDTNTQDKELFDYGDRFIKAEDGTVLFAHYSSVNEVKDFIVKNNFKLIENKLRSEICDESEKIYSWSKEDTMFYVIKKLK